MKNVSLLITALLMTLTMLGQTEKTPKVKICDVGIYQGINNNYNNSAELSDFLKLAPTSVMLQNDFTGFTKSEIYRGSSTAESIFNVNLGLIFYNEGKQSYNSNPKLNLGICFIGATSLDLYYSKRETNRFDTLSSDNSTYLIFMDSVTSQSYQMNYLYQQVGVNANLVFRTDPQARWSLYGGFGLTATASLMAATHINHNYSESMYFVFQNSTVYHAYTDEEDNYEMNTELHLNKTNISLYTYIPLGIDFRISKKNEFWKKMHLIMEMQPGIAVDFIPELGTRTFGTMRGNFGMRIEI